MIFTFVSHHGTSCKSRSIYISAFRNLHKRRRNPHNILHKLISLPFILSKLVIQIFLGTFIKSAPAANWSFQVYPEHLHFISQLFVRPSDPIRRRFSFFLFFFCYVFPPKLIRWETRPNYRNELFY